MSASAPVSTEPLHIAVAKSKGMTIDWADGHRSEYSNELLRDACPCATCTGSHGTTPQKSSYSNPQANPFPLYKPKLKMEGIEEVGSYAVRIRWNDGHNTGIYSFEHLRGICPCPACRKMREERP
jgi:DUF971 family protein